MAESTPLNASKSKVIVITGGTGGIGYQEALLLAELPEKHTIVITGRNAGRGQEAVNKLKAATNNDNIFLAIADMSSIKDVKKLSEDLLNRFPAIDELINNAGQLTLNSEIGADNKQVCSVDSIEKDFAVNVVGPIYLSRLLIPALQKASPIGRVQITSGGLSGMDDINMDDIYGVERGMIAGIPLYSHTKRVIEAATISLSREFQSYGILVNIIGGGNPGATSMTKDMGFADLPCFLRCCTPCLQCFMSRDDGGASARNCALPCVWGALATAEELGTGNLYLNGIKTKNANLTKKQKDESNQNKILELVTSLITKADAAEQISRS